jgi:superfamily I DNA/RNA helicase
MSFPLTAEQQNIIALAKTGKSFSVIAGAGAGKTSTVRAVADALPGKGLYVVFGRQAKLDAEERFRGTSVEVRTGHSLAYPIIFRAGLKRKADKWLGGGNQPFKVVNAVLGIPFNGHLGIAPWTIARLAQDTVLRWCRAAEENIEAKHVPTYQFDSLNDAEKAELAALTVPYAREVWADVIDPAGVIKFQHDHYFKLWALSHPDLSRKFDYILYDEAQDADGAIAQVILSQSIQKVLVGDTAQAIFAFRGTVDVLDRLDTQLPLSQSFRFGSAIAAEARKFLSALGSTLDLKGTGDDDEVTTLSLSEADAVLCRTNAACVEVAFNALTQGLKVHVVGGVLDATIKFAEALEELRSGKKVSHPELAAFDSYGEFVQHIQQEGKGDLSTKLALVEKFGLAGLLDIAEKTLKDAKGADLTVSTAHQSKGLEWGAVKIGEDFKAPEEGEEPSPATLKLAYVAVTRAKRRLDIGSLAWIDRFC